MSASKNMLDVENILYVENMLDVENILYVENMLDVDCQREK